MKNLIFTIALLLGTGIAFAQETSLKNSIKSNQTNERVLIQNDSKSVSNSSIIKIETVDVIKNRTKSNNTNERVGSSKSIAPDAVLTSEKKHSRTGHVTLLK